MAVITARSKSVSYPHKNIALLDNKPLMAHAIEACISCKELTNFIVSTDSEEYAKIARSWGALVPFLRPAPLAEDVPSEQVTRHALLAMEEWLDNGLKFDLVCTIQPTSPLICAEDISKCINAVGKDFDSAMTVTRVRPPHWTFGIHRDGFLVPVMDHETKGEWGVRQTYREYYMPNGMVYCTKRQVLLNGNRIIGEFCAPVIIPRVRSIDIDGPEDMDMCQAIIDANLLEKYSK